MPTDQPIDPPDSGIGPYDESPSLLDMDPVLEVVAQIKATGGSDDTAGLAAGRSGKWVQRTRKTNPVFVERVREIQARRATDAAAALSALLVPAVEAIERGLASGRTPDELRAAALVLDRFKEYRRHGASAETVADMKDEIIELRGLLSEVAAERVEEVQRDE